MPDGKSTEEWREIPGYAGYKISSLGKVCLGGELLRLQRGDYFCVQIARKSLSVHRLVLEVFRGPAPTKRHQGNHKNGIKTDNRLENLEWVTPCENAWHSLHVLGNLKYNVGHLSYWKWTGKRWVCLLTDRQRELRHRRLNYREMKRVEGKASKIKAFYRALTIKNREALALILEER